MWADSKTVWILKFGSTVQKLFDVEIRRPTPLLYKNNVKRGNFQQRMTFEPLNKISKTKLFGICPHICRKKVLIFNYFIHLNHLYPLSTFYFSAN